MHISLERLTVSARSAPADIDRCLQPFIAEACGVKPEDVTGYRILRRSLDARRKPDVRILYKLTAELRDSARPDVPASEPPPPPAPFEPENPNGLRGPLVVGAGPAG